MQCTCLFLFCPFIIYIKGQLIKDVFVQLPRKHAYQRVILRLVNS